MIKVAFQTNGCAGNCSKSGAGTASDPVGIKWS